jgi:hypothetical protein
MYKKIMVPLDGSELAESCFLVELIVNGSQCADVVLDFGGRARPFTCGCELTV